MFPPLFAIRPFLTIIVLGFACVANAQSLSPLIQKPIDDFERFREATLQDAEAKISARRTALVRDLEARVIVERRSGNLKGATALQERIDGFKKEASVAPALTKNDPERGKFAKIDFENEFEGWRKVAPITTTSDKAAHSGRLGLHLADPAGSNDLAYGPNYPIEANKSLVLRFWARGLEGTGRVGLSCYDAAGKALVHRPFSLWHMWFGAVL